MPLMESLIIDPTSFVLSSIFSIIEAGISKKADCDSVGVGVLAEVDVVGRSAFNNTIIKNKINLKAVYCLNII
jgi:hypothetical protein